MATIFVSPGVFTREQDFSVFASRIGLTRLGLVGLTQKGPAFEATNVKTTDEFLFRFGYTTSNLQMPYVANSFLQQSNELTVTRVLGKEGFDNSNAWIIAADFSTGATGSKSGSTLCTIRSKSETNGSTYLLNSATDLEIGNITTTLGSFTLSASTGPFSSETLTVSLDETREDYIVKVLGKNPLAGDFDIYVENIYPHFIREANSRGDISGINDSIVFSIEDAYTDYDSEYTNPETPWVVSKVRGGLVKNMFKFQSISDGDSANSEIKISITNIDDTTKTFDVLVRDYNDTDATAFQTAMERYRGVTMDTTQPNFIGRAIGTTDEEYPRKSMFITIDMATDYPKDTIPGGFRGYDLRSTGISGTTASDIYYKNEYFSGDSTFKTFLGVSELGYTGLTSSQVAFNKVVKTLEVDLFAFQGAVPTGQTTTKGFHMESTAPSDFITGVYNAISGYTRNEAKFTLVPAGGFDGFNRHKTPTFTSSADDANNVSVFKDAINTMANPEETDINLFSMPGINYQNNEQLVKYALAMVEDRADSLYIIDAPRLTTVDSKGTAEEAVIALQDTGIDSNYAATYWPHIQIEDVNTNQFVYIAPTSEVVRAIALTDNIAFPWFAPAGINRGTVSGNVIRADVKLNREDRDNLYAGRINPIASFVQQGVVIFGQKTLQIRQSALDRINVRRLLLQVRRLIAAASQTLLFEQNDQTLRDQFLSKVEPILLQIQNQRGLAAFNVVMDESNNTADVIDRNTLVGKIQLKPTRTAEFIDLEFQVLPTGANFQDF